MQVGCVGGLPCGRGALEACRTPGLDERAAGLVAFDPDLRGILHLVVCYPCGCVTFRDQWAPGRTPGRSTRRAGRLPDSRAQWMAARMVPKPPLTM